MQPITRQQHGIADYMYAAAAVKAPHTLGFDDEPVATKLSYAIGGTVLAQTLATRAEFGVIKAIPFSVHLKSDLALGIFAIAAPWLFGFSWHRNARNAFLGMGAVSVAASLLTQPEDMLVDDGSQDNYYEEYSYAEIDLDTPDAPLQHH